jgi:hypothetical protein
MMYEQVSVTFGRINSSTDRMIDIFKASYEPGEPRTPLGVVDMSKPGKDFLPSVLVTIRGATVIKF